MLRKVGNLMELPLKGIRVLSLTRLLPGAYCSRLLADLGAEVILLEHPGGGDPMRLRPSFFAAMNRNKKSITVDLKTEKGKEICYRLAQHSEVFIEGFRPGVAARLAVDYERIQALNPRIVYSSISGFGQDGPYRLLPGHDLVYEGIAGMLSYKVARESSDAVEPLVPTGDLSSAMFAVISILAALYDLKKSETGSYLDISMTDGLVSWMSIWLSSDEALGPWPQSAGYGVYQTQDGRHLVLGVVEEQHFWRNLCRVVSREDLGELSVQDRSQRYGELDATLKNVFLTRSRDEWLKRLREADVPAGPAYTRVSEVVNDPHLLYRRMVKNPSGSESSPQIGSPLPFSRGINRGNERVPALGEHNREILLTLGYDMETIEQLKRHGVI